MIRWRSCANVSLMKAFCLIITTRCLGPNSKPLSVCAVSSNSFLGGKKPYGSAVAIGKADHAQNISLFSVRFWLARLLAEREAYDSSQVQFEFLQECA